MDLNKHLVTGILPTWLQANIQLGVSQTYIQQTQSDVQVFCKSA